LWGYYVEYLKWKIEWDVKEEWDEVVGNLWIGILQCFSWVNMSFFLWMFEVVDECEDECGRRWRKGTKQLGVDDAPLDKIDLRNQMVIF